MSTNNTRSRAREQYDRALARQAFLRRKLDGRLERAQKLDLAGKDAAKAWGLVEETQRLLRKATSRSTKLRAPADRGDAALRGIRASAPQAGPAKKEARRQAARSRREQLEAFSKFKGTGVEVDLRLGGGARDHDVIDNRRANGDLVVRPKKPRALLDLPSDYKRHREDAIVAFGGIWHEAKAEEGMKSPDIGMKVQMSFRPGGPPKRAVNALRLAKIEEEIPPLSKEMKVLVDRIIHSRRFEQIADEIHRTRRETGRMFALALDDVARVLSLA